MCIRDRYSAGAELNRRQLLLFWKLDLLGKVSLCYLSHASVYYIFKASDPLDFVTSVQKTLVQMLHRHGVGA